MSGGGSGIRLPTSATGRGVIGDAAASGIIRPGGQRKDGAAPGPGSPLDRRTAGLARSAMAAGLTGRDGRPSPGGAPDRAATASGATSRHSSSSSKAQRTSSICRAIACKTGPPRWASCGPDEAESGRLIEARPASLKVSDLSRSARLRYSWGTCHVPHHIKCRDAATASGPGPCSAAP